MKSRRPTSSPSQTSAPEQSPQEVVEALDPSLLHIVGEHLGMGAGVLVTQLLALVPGWNDDLLNEDGSPVEQVEGASRVGDYNLEKRHKQVVGPEIEEYGDEMKPGLWQDFVAGVGDGATAAPGATYQLEAIVAQHLEEIANLFDGDD